MRRNASPTRCVFAEWHTDQLARAVRQTLLDSDLASIVPASYTRLNAAHLRSGKIGDAARGAV